MRLSKSLVGAVAAVAVVGLGARPAVGALLPPKHAAQVRTGLAPFVVIVEPSTSIAYTADLLSDTVTVVDLRRCRIGDVSGCGDAAVAAVRVGDGPDGLALDPATGTLYVANSSAGTVSVVDVRRCRAGDTSGCGRVPATVRVGASPGDVAIDSQRATAYVTNSGATTLSVIDLRRCHAADTAGCGAAPAAITVGLAPAQPAFDPATLTVYATLLGEGKVAVVDVRRCHAGDTSGCSQAPAKITVGLLPAGITVVPETNTAYVANQGSTTASVIDLRRCRAGDVSGCSQAPANVGAGLLPVGTSVDPAREVAYITNEGAATVSVFSTRNCRAGVTSGCGSPPSVVRVGLLPISVAANPVTTSAYVANSGSSTLSVIGPPQDEP
jgi:DNA-binding beta-propeller fold protein YncE